MKASCSDRRDLIDGIIIGVPNKDLGEVDNGSTYHIDDDSTCISALSWGDRSKEPKDQQRSSQETTRRLQPFPWSTPDDSSDVPHDSHEVEQNDLGIKSSNDTYRPLRRSTLVANESGLDGKFQTFGCVSMLQLFLYYHGLLNSALSFCLYFKHHGSQPAD